MGQVEASVIFQTSIDKLGLDPNLERKIGQVVDEIAVLTGQCGLPNQVREELQLAVAYSLIAKFRNKSGSGIAAEQLRLWRFPAARIESVCQHIEVIEGKRPVGFLDRLIIKQAVNSSGLSMADRFDLFSPDLFLN